MNRPYTTAPATVFSLALSVCMVQEPVRKPASLQHCTGNPVGLPMGQKLRREVRAVSLGKTAKRQQRVQLDFVGRDAGLVDPAPGSPRAGR
jgi:hypothetical protein